MRLVPVALVLVLFSLPALASTYTVNNDGDAVDVNPGNDICQTSDGVCTLRAAIMEANAHAGADDILFSTADPILVTTPLPAITGITHISGATAPGYTTAPVVVVDGAASVNIGLNFAAGSDGSSLTALQLYGFSETAVIVSANNVGIRRNYLGPVGGGTANQDGIQLFGSGNVVGGNDGFGNVISGNTRYGVLAAGSDHEIKDNLIGTTADGLAALANGDDGVRLFSAATGILVGSFFPGEGNVISGNGANGIHVDNASGNTVAGNYIGTDGTGAAALGNGGSGVEIVSGTGNIIGGGDGRNVISGNFADGVTITSGTGNTVQNNYIGTDVTGANAIGNVVGVRVLASTNSIGAAGGGNVISGNDEGGITLESGVANILIRGNIIGLDATGTAGIGNGGAGISVDDASEIDIGGLAVGEGNVVSFNLMGIFANFLTDSRMYGNTIGLDAGGANTLGNALGVLIVDSDDVIFGDSAARNIVSGNSALGLVFAGGSGHVIQHNYVGTDATGNIAQGNLATGIEVDDTTAAVIRNNVVSANGGHGIEATLGATGTIIHSNLIGVGADGTTSLPNTGDGVNVCDFATGTIVGDAALGGNVIANNGANGIGVMPSALSGNTWAANSIFNNTDLGIDLEIDGITVNDPDDIDEGPNQLQNFPVLVSATTTATASQVRGTIDTTPNTTVTVHVFSNATPDPSGNGEGQTYLGVTSFTTDVNGEGSFVFTGPPLTVGHEISTTATTTDGTSEFSQNLAVNAAPVISFSQPAYAIGEGGTSMTITVTRSGDLTALSTVQYATSNNTATAGADYTSSSGTLTFLPGDAEETFSVPITQDAMDEPDELVNLTLSNPTAATLGTSSAQLTITDDDAPPSITISDVTLAEGNAGTTNFQFVVSLSNPSSVTQTVDYATADNTAISPGDYTAIPTTTLTFLPGETSKNIDVSVAGETMRELDQTFFVNLTNPTGGATIGDGQATGTILNDDAIPTITINDPSTTEGNGGSTNLPFTVTLSNLSELPVNITYSSANNTATAGSDYTAVSNTLTINGTISGTIVVPVLGDITDEPTETFFLNLTAADNATFTDNQGLGTIGDDDSPPSIEINDVSLAEGNAGTTPFSFVVNLSNPSSQTITVDYATANDTATAPADYTAIPATTLTFNPGETIKNVVVNVVGENLVEPNETFFVNLSNNTGASSIGVSQGLGTIMNDEGVPTLIIDDVTLNEGNAGTTNFVFTVTLSAPSASNVTVNYATQSDSAVSPADYTSASGTATITAGTTSTTITVAVNGDTQYEINEQFRVNLTAPVNAAISDAQGIGTITNDDMVPTLIVNDVALAEGNGGTTNFVFTLTLSNTTYQAVNVGHTTANDTATAGTDYTTTNGNAIIAPGTLTQTITVPVTGDALNEPNETFFLNLTSADNATITDNQGLGTINNDDAVPSVIVSDVSLNEGNAGTTNFVFTVTLSAVSEQNVQVEYTTANGSAIAGSDYTASTASVTIPAGSLSAQLTIAVTGDTAFEPDETFFVDLTAATNATIADNQGLGTITNDDVAPTANLSITKTASATTFTPNQQITYTITVSNTGPSAATGVTVTDTLPAGATFVSVSGATCAGTSTITCTIPALAMGSSQVITLVISANGNAPITNTASVTAIEIDPNAANNASTATINPAADAAAIPTASTWGLLLLAAALALFVMKRT